MRRLAFAFALLLLTGCRTFAQSPRIQTPLTATTCPGVGCTTLSVSGLGAASVQVTGTFVGTLQFETSLDGVTYATWSVTPSGGGMAVTSATATGVWQGAVGGLAILRTRFSAYSSGTATVTMQAADNGTNLLTQSNTWTGTQTFDDLTVTGTCTGCGGGGSAGGLDTEIQFNDSGDFGGDSTFVWDKTANRLTIGIDPNSTDFNDWSEGWWGNNGSINIGLIQPTGDGSGLVVQTQANAQNSHAYGAQIAATGFGTTVTGLDLDAFFIDDDAMHTGGNATGLRVAAGNSTNGAPLQTAISIDIATAGTNRTIASMYGLRILDQTVTAATTANYAIDVNGKFRVDPDGAGVALGNGGALKTSKTTAQTALLQAYDVDGTAYSTFATLTNGNTPTFVIAPPAGGTVTVQATTFKSSDGTTGVTVSACTGFKNGLCISGT